MSSSYSTFLWLFILFTVLEFFQQFKGNFKSIFQKSRQGLPQTQIFLSLCLCLCATVIDSLKY